MCQDPLRRLHMRRNSEGRAESSLLFSLAHVAAPRGSGAGQHPGEARMRDQNGSSGPHSPP